MTPFPSPSDILKRPKLELMLREKFTELGVHINIMHKTLSCDLCEYSCQNLTSLNMHIDKEHDTTDDNILKQKDNKTSASENNSSRKSEDVEGNFSCDECSFKSQLCYNYMAHANFFHTDEQRLKCDKCDYQTQNNEEFILHLRNVHKKEITSVDE